jgi:SAM-dependent methyltransferase
MHPLLRSVLACPRCKASLRVEERACACTGCGASFALEDDIPRLADDARSRDPRIEAEWRAQSHARSMYADDASVMNLWEREVLPHFVDWLDGVHGPVLEVGCAVGFLGRGLVEQGRRVDLIGLDFHAELLAEVTEGYSGLVEGDAHRLPLRDGAFRAVIATNTLHHVAEPAVVVREIARVLAPGGIFIAYDPRKVAPIELAKRIVRHGHEAFTEHHKAFRPDEYREFMEGAGLRVLDLETRNPLAPLVATGLDILRVGRLGVSARWLARSLIAVDRLVAGAAARSPLGLMVASRAQKN